MSKLSNLFGGQFAHMSTGIDKVFAINKEKEFDMKEKSFNIKNKVNAMMPGSGKIKTLDMPAPTLNIKSPVLDKPAPVINRSPPVNLDKKYSDIFKLKNERFKKASMKVMPQKPNMQMNNMLGVTSQKSNMVDQIAKRRLWNQRELSLFGDKDKDGVPNILDCMPKNPHKQGPEQNVSEYVYDTDAANPETVEVEEPEPTKIEKVRSWLEKTGLINKKENEQISPYEQLSEEEIKQERLKDLELKRKIELEKLKGEQRLKELQFTKQKKYDSRTDPYNKYVGGNIRKFSDPIQQGISAFGTGAKQASWAFTPVAAGQKISALTGFGSSGRGMFMARELASTKTTGGTYPQKVYDLIGGKQPPDIQQPISEPVMQPTLQPVAQPILQPIPQQSPYGEESVAPPQPGMVWSEKSKKWVKYTRRPYRKTVPYQPRY